MSDEELWMQKAIDQARAGIAAGQTPFGAVIVHESRLIAAAHNTVWADTDPTAHAEVNAIRLAARETAQIQLSGCTLFTTCEPCPMCLSAIHWSKIDRVVYGATIEDAAQAGFSELRVPAQALARQGGSALIVEPGPLASDCRALFELWRDSRRSGTY